MLNGRRLGLSMSLRRNLSKVKLPKSFDLDLVTRGHEENTIRATISPSSNEPSLNELRLILPPPNVTGRLHIGHALTVTIQDVLARYHRIRGGKCSWIPGMDHAGIATQSVVERELWRREKKTRHDMSKEQFIHICHQFAKENGTVIRSQMNRLGATLDWNNEYYTLDERFSSGVNRAFVTLYKEGLISRDKRFVHWSPSLKSSISDQEVDKVEVPNGGIISIPCPYGKGRRDVKIGTMYTIKYEVVGETNKWVEVATTRPETIYADISLAIHPSHSRINELKGKEVKNPLDGRIMPIIVDEGVILDKGTGILKITPSHDRLDADIASRHWNEIERIVHDARTRSCIDENGRICGGNELDGMDRFDARDKVVSILSSSGHLIGSKDSSTSIISICSRTGDIIEPRLTSQWFLHCSDLHEEAKKALLDGRLSIVPQSQSERLLDWFAYSEPWCLSRQLVWGHRIPAWKIDASNEWIVEKNERDVRSRIGNELSIRQDDDVLDTWFSSGLVPLICGGWMEGRNEWNEPPLSLLETGNDILGFWVARMIILTMKLSGGQVPFSKIMLHGLVRDAQGRKMSKSLGNVIDPLDVIDGISLDKMEERLKMSSLNEKEKVIALSSLRSRFPNGIPRCGSDSLRFALLRHDILANDVPIDIGTLATEGLRFCNKLWNLVAYAEEVKERIEGVNGEGINDPMDDWIRSRLSSTMMTMNRYMSEDSLHLSFSSLHQFILSSLSDIYIECTKKSLWEDDKNRLINISNTLDFVLSNTFKQLSVFMPFVSQFLYHRITDKGMYETPIKVSPSFIDRSLEDTVSELMGVVSSARSLKQQLGVPNKTHFTGVLHSSLPSSSLSPLLPILSHLSHISIDSILPLSSPSPQSFEVTSVPGHNARLALKVEDSHRLEMRRVLEERLKKIIEKKELYREKALRYSEIAEEERSRGPKRIRSVEKNVKKSEQARIVSENAMKEEERIRNMIR